MGIKMLKAVIFDFDGVIVDSESLHHETFNIALAPFGIDISKRLYYDKYLGYTDLDAIKVITKENNLALSADEFNQILEKKASAFEHLAATTESVIEGAEDFINMLSQNEIIRTICSGALVCEIEAALDGTPIRPNFCQVTAADDVKVGKPDPEGYLMALDKLKQEFDIAPENCIVVEDSHWGLEAAKAAGIKTLAVTNSYPSEQLKKADKITDNLASVTIAQLNQMTQ
jgi:beta-phosphoglucomutase